MGNAKCGRRPWSCGSLGIKLKSFAPHFHDLLLQTPPLPKITKPACGALSLERGFSVKVCIYMYIYIWNHIWIILHFSGPKRFTPCVRPQKRPFFGTKFRVPKLAFFGCLSCQKTALPPVGASKLYKKMAAKPNFYRVSGQSPPYNFAEMPGLLIMWNPSCEKNDSGRGNVNNVNHVKSLLLKKCLFHGKC